LVFIVTVTEAIMVCG